MKKFAQIFLTGLLFLTACAPSAQATRTLSELYDYCAITPSSNLVDQSAAGTPIPPEAVKIIAQGDLEQVKTMDFNIVGQENFSENNFAIIFAPVGFSEGAADKTISELTKGIKANFGDVNLDFGYIDRSIPIGINLLQYSANFLNWDEFYAFKERIDSRADHAVIVFVINSNEAFASAYDYEITISANTANIDLVVSHEMGHIFGLDDGYPAYRNPESLPNNELWFADDQPDILKAAVAKVENPPVYQVGSCNGRPLFSYYNPSYNIMWSEMHHFGQPWGSIFTPVQSEMINLNVAEMLAK